MDFSNLSLAEIIFILVLISAFGIAIFKAVSNYINGAKGSDNFFDYIMNDFKNKIMPVITQIVFKEELIGCATYDDFKKKCIKSITSGIYEFLENNMSTLPPAIVPFITIGNCETVIRMMIENGSIEKILQDAYDQKQKEMVNAMELEEAKAIESAINTGVEDETKLEKEALSEEEKNEPVNYI